jgi:sulfonate transport system ATP-binding protein
MPDTSTRTSLAFDAELGQSAFPVRFESVGRTFAPGAPVLTDVSLDVAAGEVIAILGPSGCG